MTTQDRKEPARRPRPARRLTDETTAGTEADGTEPAGTEAEGTEPAGSEPEGGAGAEIGGSACGEPHGPYEENAEPPSGEVRVAWNQAPYSFNQNTNRGNADGQQQPAVPDEPSAGRASATTTRT